MSTKTIDEIREHKMIPQLREFIYLDDISILSLLSSIQGSLTKGGSTSQSESHDSTKSAEAGPSLFKVGFHSNTQSERVSKIDFQINIQAHFRELVNTLEKHGLQYSIEPNHPISLEHPIKGKIIEAPVSIRPLPEYTLYRVMSELYDAVKNSGSENALTMLDSNFIFGYSILDRMQVDLIPVILTVHGGRYSNNTEQIAFNMIPDGKNLDNNLQFVSYIKKNNCWQDPALFLYNENLTYNALIRLQDDHTTSNWNGFPLLDTFRAMGPTLNDFNDSIANIVNLFSQNKDDTLSNSELPRLTYIKSICDFSALSPEQIDHLLGIKGDNIIDIFSQIDGYLDSTSDLRLDGEALETKKKDVISTFNINPFSSEQFNIDHSGTNDHTHIPESFRSEIIAIYW